MNLQFIKNFLTNFSTPDGKPDYRKLIFPLASIITSVIIFVLVVVPQVLQLFENQNELNSLKNQADNLDSKISSLAAISTPDFELDLKLVSNALPLSKDYIDSTPYIQEAVDKSNVSLTGISFAESPQVAGVNSYMIKLDIDGNLTQLNQFLSIINHTPRVLRVDRIELSGDSNQSKYSATITIKAFYSPIQKQALTLTQPVVNLSDQESNQISQLEKTIKNFNLKTPTDQVGRNDPFN